MSEGRRNQTTGLLFLGLGALLLIMSMTNVPGAAAFIVLGVVLFLIGMVLVSMRRGGGA